MEKIIQRSILLMLCGICWFAWLNQVVFGQKPELVVPVEHIENSVICLNYLYLTHKLANEKANEKAELLKALKEGSIITWRHVNFHGEYDFSDEKLKDSIGFNFPEIPSWKLDEKRE